MTDAFMHSGLSRFDFCYKSELFFFFFLPGNHKFSSSILRHDVQPHPRPEVMGLSKHKVIILKSEMQ